MKKHDNVFIKKQNKKWVLEIIKTQRPISRAAIARITRMSATSISRIVHELALEGYVRETDLSSSGVGRKANLLDICVDAIYAIGIDLTEKYFKIGILNYMDNIFYMKKFLNKADESPMETLKSIAEAIEIVIEEKNIPPEKIVGIGIGLPGYIDYKNGFVILSIQLNWENLNIGKILEDLTGYSVLVDNDLKMLAMAEFLSGAAESSKSSVLIGIGSGVGSAIIMNGEFFRGENNIAGEISHNIVDINGDLCKCGKIGCLNTFVTEKSIIQQASKFEPVTSVDKVIEFYNKGENWAINIINRAATYIAITISNCLYLYNPEVLVLSGFIMEDYPEIRALVEQKYKMYITEPFKVQVKYAELSENGIVMGSALQAQKILFDFENIKR